MSAAPGGDARDGTGAKGIFLRVLSLPPASRPAAVAEMSDGDETLRAEVESLLRFHHEDTFLEEPAFEASSIATPAAGGPAMVAERLEPGTRVGTYRMVRLLGAGGMGMVYEAVQDAPRRAVALKVMRPGLLSREMLRRFQREAQTLGMLQHPGIAQVYEAGMERLTGPDGAPAGVAPFLAMELIDGAPMGVYLARVNPPTRARLEIFQRLCDAVAHAHSRGVVHRDLKPANVLIDASGLPRVLDFGIARLLTHDDAGASLATHAGQLLGTPAYMSPEQFLGDPARIDVRADVYALGVMLYELLSGRLPLEVRSSSLHEVAGLVRDHEPLPLGRLDPRWRGDLETIAGRAMEKDPARRYQSAAELGEDVRRFLRDEPILARPPSRAYQLRKFARRNRVAVLGGVGVSLTLVAGMASTLWQARVAARERDAAREESASAAQVAQFLSDLLAAPDPENTRGREVTVLELIDRAARALESDRAARPGVRAKLHTTLGKTYGGLGRYPEAERHQRAALDDLRADGRERGPAAWDVMSGLSDSLRRQGKRDEAEAVAQRGLDEARASDLSPEARDSTIFRLVTALANTLDPTDPRSTPLYREAADAAVRAEGVESDSAAMAWSNLSVQLGDTGDLAGAEEFVRRAAEIRTRLLGPDHPSTLISGANLGLVLAKLGRTDDASGVLVDVVARSGRTLGVRHPSFLPRLLALAQCLARSGRDAEAIDTLASYASRARDESGRATDASLDMDGLRATLLIAGRRFEPAEILARAVMADAESIYPPDHDRVTQTWTLFADLYEAWGRREEYQAWINKLKGTKWLPDEPVTPASSAIPETK
ncbi:MAG: serine/threonine protein kinase [Phycisphaerae bacterium]|nr:serine/threonine protein kinase [Phycisphaerae bacterium]